MTPDAPNPDAQSGVPLRLGLLREERLREDLVQDAGAGALDPR